MAANGGAGRAPGPKGHWLLGSLREFTRDYHAFVDEVARRYAPIAHFRVGPEHFHVVCSSELVQEVLVDRRTEFRKSARSSELLERFLGESMMTLEGPRQKQQRRLSTPAFSRERMLGYAEKMLDCGAAHVRGWSDGQELDFDEEMRNLSMAVVTKTLLDVDTGPVQNQIGEALHGFEEYFVQLLSMPFLPPRWLPTRANRSMLANRQKLDGVVSKVIRERRQSQVDRGDLLSIWMSATEGEDGFSESDLLATAKTMYVAAFETTSKAMAWCWYALALHPEVEAELHREVDEVVGERELDAEMLSQMTFARCVVLESLRLYTSVPIFGRSAWKDTTLAGYQIGRDELIFISVSALHRDERYFADPGRFDPARWTREFEKSLPKSAYMPFGLGSRRCIGFHFAVTEMIGVLVEISRRFRVVLRGDVPVCSETLITMGPRGGLPVRLEARSRGEARRGAADRRSARARPATCPASVPRGASVEPVSE